MVLSLSEVSYKHSTPLRTRVYGGLRLGLHNLSEIFTKHVDGKRLLGATLAAAQLGTDAGNFVGDGFTVPKVFAQPADAVYEQVTDPRQQIPEQYRLESLQLVAATQTPSGWRTAETRDTLTAQELADLERDWDIRTNPVLKRLREQRRSFAAKVQDAYGKSYSEITAKEHDALFEGVKKKELVSEGGSLVERERTIQVVLNTDYAMPPSKNDAAVAVIRLEEAVRVYERGIKADEESLSLGRQNVSRMSPGKLKDEALANIKSEEEDLNRYKREVNYLREAALMLIIGEGIGADDADRDTKRANIIRERLIQGMSNGLQFINGTKGHIEDAIEILDSTIRSQQKAAKRILR